MFISVLGDYRIGVLSINCDVKWWPSKENDILSVRRDVV